ncbi:Lactosylceramide 4-alpha-galactosyltransferase [Gryllus bimaculatus]|nr:Lactosylceramide 4-alpha-galactosyltransferase [Gryllus bimaculatus]
MSGCGKVYRDEIRNVGDREQCASGVFPPQVSDMTPERCAGFRVLPPSAFFPVPWPQWRRYFQEQGAALTMAAINGSYVIHVWNRMSAAANVWRASFALELRKVQEHTFETYCPWKTFTREAKQ